MSKRPHDDTLKGQTVDEFMSQGFKNKRVKMTQQNEEEIEEKESSDESEESEEESDSQDSEDSESESESESESSSPAEAGIIEKITLKNFMCHSSFELDLGPQLNFIIGKNGSGKSAILTGISVCLGAKASDTNRGSSIKDLIKDGQSMARVAIVFSNKGPQAYEHEVYGDSITVERKLVRIGANTYSIKSHDGKVISKKKTVLEELLFRFNIRVDNPLSFLSQDKAREFLTLTTDHAKYNYFMAGALIDDILDNYRKTHNDIILVRDKLSTAKDQYNTAVTKYNESLSVYEKFRQSDTLRNKLQTIHGKVYWFNVTKVESILNKHKNIVETLETQLRDIESQVEVLMNTVQESRDKISENQRLKAELSVKVSNSKMTASSKKEEVNSAHSKVKEYAVEIESNQDNIKQLNEQIEKLTQDIVNEQQRIEQLNGGSREVLTDKLEQLQSQRTKVVDSRTELKEKLETFDDNEDTQTVRSEILEVDNNIRDLKDKRFNLTQSNKDKYIAWGRGMSDIITAIRRTKQWHKPPIGPIGSYIEVKQEYSQWKDLVNAVLQRPLDSFLVYDEHDRKLLSNILRNFNINKNIITRKFETFNYEQGIPRFHKTFLDILSIRDENIMYTLIDTNSIEKSVIASTRSEATQIIGDQNVLNVFTLLSNTSGQRTSGDKRNFNNDPVFYPRTLHKLSISSETGELMTVDEQIAFETNRKQQLIMKQRELKIQLQNKKEDLKSALRVYDKKIKSMDAEIYSIQSNLEDNGMSKIDSLKNQIEDNKNQIINSENIIISVTKQLETDREKYDNLKVEYKAMVKEVEQESRQLDQAAKAITDSNNRKEEAIAERANLEMKKDELSHAITRSNTKITDAETKLKELTEQAQELCDQSEVDISPEDTAETIAKEYQMAQEAVNDAERAVGQPFEVIQRELMENKTIKDDYTQLVEDLTRIYQELNSDLASRIDYLRTTLSRNTHEASMSFERCLGLRGFKGRLRFNFEQKLLTMLVQTKSDSSKRTVESLSGGEKSFTQIALLLSIWKIMDSRVRGLDEFDVFMDSVNRTISIKLLLQELRNYPKSQSIFITPQDIAAIGDLDSEDVRIHRMESPRER